MKWTETFFIDKAPAVCLGPVYHCGGQQVKRCMDKTIYVSITPVGLAAMDILNPYFVPRPLCQDHTITYQHLQQGTMTDSL